MNYFEMNVNPDYAVSTCVSERVCAPQPEKECTAQPKLVNRCTAASTSEAVRTTTVLFEEKPNQLIISPIVGTCSLPNCVRSGQGGKVMEQVTRLNNKVVVEKFDAMKEVYEEVTRDSRARVIGLEIARRMSLFEEDGDMEEQVDRVPSKQDKVVMDMNIVKKCDKVTQVRKVVIARRKRTGQPKERGVTVARIDDIFRARTSPMVSGKKRQQFDEEGPRMKRSKGV